MQAALGVGVQQGEGVVAAVIDDDVAGSERVEMQAGGAALVGVGVQAEVDRQAGAQPVQAGEQALRAVGRRGGGAVAFRPPASKPQRRFSRFHLVPKERAAWQS